MRKKKKEIEDGLFSFAREFCLLVEGKSPCDPKILFQNPCLQEEWKIIACDSVLQEDRCQLRQLHRILDPIRDLIRLPSSRSQARKEYHPRGKRR